MGDVLRLEGMRFFGHHGDSAADRETGAHIDVDVEISTDTSAAGRSDDLNDTIDYAACVETVRGLVESESHHLLESLAEAIASALLTTTSAAAVRVVVGKRPPLPATIERFRVDITRRRQ
jgi:dihydroneopterin aldolase